MAKARAGLASHRGPQDQVEHNPCGARPAVPRIGNRPVELHAPGPIPVDREADFAHEPDHDRKMYERPRSRATQPAGPGRSPRAPPPTASGRPCDGTRCAPSACTRPDCRRPQPDAIRRALPFGVRSGRLQPTGQCRQLQVGVPAPSFPSRNSLSVSRLPVGFSGSLRRSGMVCWWRGLGGRVGKVTVGNL